MAEYIVQRAASKPSEDGHVAEASGVGIPVTTLTLRHCFAVHSLQAGMNIRQLQETLGHLHIDSTMRYARVLSADGMPSPLDDFDSPPQPHQDPCDELFDEPLEPGPLLSQDTWMGEAQALYASLKTQLHPRRFLANRAFRPKPG